MIERNVLAIIPARGGSKGLPRKNILDLGGRPLIAWTIEASLKSEYISRTIVSSDDDEILDVSRYYGASILKRPNALAKDASSSESVVRHVLENVCERYDYVILLQPTSPLRNNEDIDSALSDLFNSEATALISVCETDNKLLKAFKVTDGGYIEGVSNNEYPFMNRQDLPRTYMSNGALYIINVDEFHKNGGFFTDKTISFVMDEIKSVDIDSLEELNNVRRIVNNE